MDSQLRGVILFLSLVSRVMEGRGDTTLEQSLQSNYSVPTFPSSFSMTVDLYYNTTDSRGTLSASIWLAGDKLKARMDTYGSILKTYIEKNDEKMTTYEFFPIAINSKDFCVKKILTKDNTIFFINLNVYLKSNFKHVGKENFRGMETDKFYNETDGLQITVYMRPQKSSKDPTKEMLTPITLIVSMKSLTQRYEITSFSEENSFDDIFIEPLDKSQCVDDDAMDKIYDRLKENCAPIREDRFSFSPEKLPDNFDWRELGAVNENKDECTRELSWSCAAAGVVEGAYFLSTNRTKLLRLSKQVLMDCSVAYKRGIEARPRAGEHFAYEWIKHNGGMPEENDYPGPHTGVHESCQIQNVFTKPTTIEISRWSKVPSKNPLLLKAALIRYGPIAVRFQADLASIMKHSEGIYNDPTCGDKEFILPYCGLLVGFGKENNEEYWIVNPFWGASVGQQGYFKFAIENNICGIMNEATFVVL
ncbi:digestive cysteine proteinase 1-like isoform X2 [Planococcus citri]|uniref:digestive cysteine proteinase 1-like isoform X2 n=1 Tax=Planococcus citri TaxID=170843 RepID=UPI0031F7B2C8